MENTIGAHPGPHMMYVPGNGGGYGGVPVVAPVPKRHAVRHLSSLRQERGLLAVLFLLSAVEALATIFDESYCLNRSDYDDCGSLLDEYGSRCEEAANNSDNCNGFALLLAACGGFVTALLSAVLLCLLYYQPNAYNSTSRVICVPLLVLWAVATGAAAVRPLFMNLGNGYFAAWGSLLAALFFCETRLGTSVDSGQVPQQHVMTATSVGHAHHPGRVHPTIPQYVPSPPLATSTQYVPSPPDATVQYVPSPADATTQYVPSPPDATVQYVPIPADATTKYVSALEAPNPSLPPRNNLVAVFDQQVHHHHSELPPVDHSAHLRTLGALSDPRRRQ